MMAAPDTSSHASTALRVGDTYPIPAYDTPRSRLNDVGPAALSEAEVLSLVLGGRPDKALTQARALLSKFGGLHGLLRANTSELSREHGVGPVRAAQLKAALELGRRLLLTPTAERLQIRCPEDVAALLMVEMGPLDQEQLRVLLLDTRHQLIRQVLVYSGNVSTSLVRVGELFREAVRENAPAILLTHNHPSQDPSPSPEDVAVTREVVAAGQLLDVQVLDHLIVTQQRYVSLRERGLGFGR